MSQSARTQPHNQEDAICCDYCKKEFKYISHLMSHYEREECEQFDFEEED